MSNPLPNTMRCIMNKYRNKKTIRFGITFDSIKEADRYTYLYSLVQAGEITDLKTQVPFVVIDKNDIYRDAKYLADFTYNLITPNGKEFVVEDVKGMKRGTAYTVFKLKQKLMYSRYEIVVREV